MEELRLDSGVVAMRPASVFPLRNPEDTQFV